MAAEGSRLESIQALRALAALMVVAFHVLGDVAVIGAAGVDVFFVISGFVIALVTAPARVDPLVFAYDRAARILPLYWLATALLVATKVAAPALLPRLPLDPGWILASFLLVPTVLPGTALKVPFLYQGWTLWSEALFYVVVTLVLLAGPRRRGAMIAAVLVGLVAAGLVLRPQGPVGWTYTNPLLLEFLAGYLFARWRGQGGRLGAAAGAWLIVLAAAGFVAAAAFAGAPEGWPRILWWGLPALALVTGAVALEGAGKVRVPSFVLLLGAASYAIYLSHGIAISILTAAARRLGHPLGEGFDQPLVAAAIFLAAVAAGLAVHRLAERPIMALTRRLRDRLFSARADAPPLGAPLPAERPLVGGRAR